MSFKKFSESKRPSSSVKPEKPVIAPAADQPAGKTDAAPAKTAPKA